MRYHLVSDVLCVEIVLQLHEHGHMNLFLRNVPTVAPSEGGGHSCATIGTVTPSANVSQDARHTEWSVNYVFARLLAFCTFLSLQAQRRAPRHDTSRIAQKLC